VVELQKSKLGEDHPDMLASMHNLAIWYSEAGRRPEPLELTEQVVELQSSQRLHLDWATFLSDTKPSANCCPDKSELVVELVSYPCTHGQWIFREEKTCRALRGRGW
jgi:hypothetical protein